MPIYDFKCTACDYQDEIMRKASAESTMECPACRKEAFSKMLSAPSFQLNGTGWYATDFKNSNNSVAKTDSTADSKADIKTETKAAEETVTVSKDVAAKTA